MFQIAPAVHSSSFAMFEVPDMLPWMYPLLPCMATAHCSVSGGCGWEFQGDLRFGKNTSKFRPKDLSRNVVLFWRSGFFMIFSTFFADKKKQWGDSHPIALNMSPSGICIGDYRCEKDILMLGIFEVISIFVALTLGIWIGLVFWCGPLTCFGLFLDPYAPSWTPLWEGGVATPRVFSSPHLEVRKMTTKRKAQVRNLGKRWISGLGMIIWVFP